jgi:hypothetical protein
MIVDILFIASTILIIWLGWSAGLARTFFAVLAGFVAIFAADKYPYQEGMNAYLIFSIAVVFIIMLGAFTIKIINFFYLNIFDRIGGAFLSVCVWIIVFINIVIPSVTNWTSIDVNSSYVYGAFAKTIQSKIPVFKDYVPLFFEKREK